MPRQSRHVTALVLGDPTLAPNANWMEFSPRENGVTVVSEKFAKRRLPAAALAALRYEPCFYIRVDDLASAVAQVPGRQVGTPVLSHGMREICVETQSGMVVLAERA